MGHSFINNTKPNRQFNKEPLEQYNEEKALALWVKALRSDQWKGKRDAGEIGKGPNREDHQWWRKPSRMSLRPEKRLWQIFRIELP